MEKQNYLRPDARGHAAGWSRCGNTVGDTLTEAEISAALKSAMETVLSRACASPIQPVEEVQQKPGSFVYVW